MSLLLRAYVFGIPNKTPSSVLAPDKQTTKMTCHLPHLKKKMQAYLLGNKLGNREHELPAWLTPKAHHWQ